MNIDSDLINAFYEAADLSPRNIKVYSRRREAGNEYAQVRIIDCEYKDWWYAEYIGVECFCLLNFRDWRRRFLYDLNVVNLTNSRILVGKSLSPKDIVLI